MEVCRTPLSRRMGSKRPERGRGQAHADHDRVEHEMGGGEDRPDAQGEQERGHPGAPGPAQVPVAHRGQVELGPGQEHQVGQAEVGERSHHGVRVGQRQHVGADDDAQGDLDHDFGDGHEAPDDLGDERGQDGGESDQDAGWEWPRRHVMLGALAFVPSSPATSRAHTLRAAPRRLSVIATTRPRPPSDRALG